MNKSQIIEIMTPEYKVELAALETADEVKASLAAKGLELSLDEINKIRDLAMSHSGSQGELTESELENVAGGGLFTTIAELFLDGFDAVDRWTKSRW